MRGDCGAISVGSGENPPRSGEGATEPPLRFRSPFAALPGSGSEALSAPAVASKLRRLLLRQKRTFRCSSGGGGSSDDLGQRPLPLTAASPSPSPWAPLPSPCPLPPPPCPSPREGAGGVARGRYKVRGSRSRAAAQTPAPLQPAAWAGPRMRRSARLALLRPAC